MYILNFILSNLPFVLAVILALAHTWKLYRNTVISKEALISRTIFYVFILSIICILIYGFFKTDQVNVKITHVSDVAYFIWTFGAAYGGYEITRIILERKMKLLQKNTVEHIMNVFNICICLFVSLLTYIFGSIARNDPGVAIGIAVMIIVFLMTIKALDMFPKDV